MTLMQFLRSKQKLVTWVLLMPVVVAFSLFGLGFAINAIFGSEEREVIYKIHGEDVKKGYHIRTAKVWGAINQDRSFNEDDVKEVVGECILAKKYGFTATDAEIDIQIAEQFQGNQKTYQATLKQLGLTPEELRLWFRQKTLREKYSNFRRSIITPTASEVYSKFLFDRYNYVVKYAHINPEDYAEDVIVNEEKLRELYDESVEKWQEKFDLRVRIQKMKASFDVNDDELAELEKQLRELSGDPLIDKCDIDDGPYAEARFVYVPYDEVRKNIEYDPEGPEITEHYYDNIANYREDNLPEPVYYGPFAPDTESPDETSTPPPDYDQPPPRIPNPDVDNDYTVNKLEAYTPYGDWDGSEFKELDAVREDVIDDYLSVRAKDKADEILTEVRNLISEMYLTKFNFDIINSTLQEKLGEKYSIQLDKATFSMQEAETLETYGSTELKIKAFTDESYWTHASEERNDSFSPVMEVTGGKYMFFVENEKPAKVKPYEEVKEQVEVAYRYRKQRELAKQRAMDIIEALNAGQTVEDLSSAVSWMEAKGTKANLMFFDKFGEALEEGTVAEEPIWIEDQQTKAWRVQVLVKATPPELSLFAEQFSTYQNKARSDAIGTDPADPKGILGAWSKFDKKLFGIEEED
ncbi:MAG: hypothetical protein U5N86_12970 [Planctomycetota bacterium]|nr:hypothetical protein [Planctomycetota bacterium]